MKNIIIIFLGPSSSGKDTLARLLEKQGYNFIVSTTTRPMRYGESERNPYHFVTNEEFEKLIKNDELIEYREYDTLVNNIPAKWYYGVEKKEVDPEKQYVVVLDTVGLLEFKSHFKDKIMSFFIDVSDEIRKNRCLSRGDFDEFEWNRRLADDKIRFSNEIISSEVQHIINGEKSPEQLLEDVINIINQDNKLL